MSSLEKKCSKYDSLYRTSESTLLLKSEQYQENDTSSTPSPWFFYIAAVVFTVIYTSTYTAYTAGGDNLNQLTEFRLSRKRKVAEKMKKIRTSQKSENEPPQKKLCEDVEVVPVSKCGYKKQESVTSYTVKPWQALKGFNYFSREGDRVFREM